MSNAQFRLSALSLLFLLSFGSNLCSAAAGQDSLGGASLIFIEHPKNPPVHPKALRPKAQTNQPNPAAAPATDKEKALTSADLADEVEDALALGNSARDAEPPRYQDAEKAYRLAAKLDDDDPRPYLGLANLWYDQKELPGSSENVPRSDRSNDPKETYDTGSFQFENQRECQREYQSEPHQPVGKRRGAPIFWECSACERECSQMLNLNCA